MTYRHKHITISFLIILTFTCSFQSFGQDAKNKPGLNSDSVAVVQTINEFTDAFTNCNWERFTECFADDATAFFPPSAKFPYRANNKIEIENIFKGVFENARKQKSKPPYIDIHPKDLKIQMSGSAAIVTFLLYDPDLLGRRTIVLKKDNDKWKIIHLHASGINISK